MPISITDNDKEPNAGPYKLEIIGDGASLFAFDSTLNLITTKRLPPHSKKEVYLLSVCFQISQNKSFENLFFVSFQRSNSDSLNVKSEIKIFENLDNLSDFEKFFSQFSPFCRLKFLIEVIYPRNVQ